MRSIGAVLIGSIAGATVVCLLASGFIFGVCYLAEFRQSPPDWDIAQNTGLIFFRMYGPVAAILGTLIGGFAGKAWQEDRKRRLRETASNRSNTSLVKKPSEP